MNDANNVQTPTLAVATAIQITILPLPSRALEIFVLTITTTTLQTMTTSAIRLFLLTPECKLNCYLTNARSIVNKLRELHYLMYVAKFDIIAITETWLHDNVANGLLDPESLFNIVRKDRKADVKGGGVCALVKKCWSVIPIDFDDEFADLEIVGFDLIAAKTRIRYFVVYRPPKVDSLSAIHLGRIINCLARYESSHTNVIVGDLNLPKINWSDLSCPSDNLHRPFLTFLVESSYSQLVGFPTHATDTLDVVLTSDRQYFQQY